MAAARRYRLDDLRRLATALASGAGVAPARASALASQLLWFDAAGAARLGIARLPDLLSEISGGKVDPKAEGTVVSERSGTAVIDGGRGVPLLVLDRAAGIAGEKARDVGLGVVRVENLGPATSAAGVAAELAVGPFAAAVVGPGVWSVALPCAGGLPAVYDPALADASRAPKGSRKPTPASEVPAHPALAWARSLVPEGGWLVAAATVAALEPLATFQGRVADALAGLKESDGRLLPGPWEARRTAARESGVSLPRDAEKALQACADRLGVERPEPLA